MSDLAKSGQVWVRLLLLLLLYTHYSRGIAAKVRDQAAISPRFIPSQTAVNNNAVGRAGMRIASSMGVVKLGLVVWLCVLWVWFGLVWWVVKGVVG